MRLPPQPSGHQKTGRFSIGASGRFVKVHSRKNTMLSHTGDHRSPPGRNLFRSPGANPCISGKAVVYCQRMIFPREGPSADGCASAHRRSAIRWKPVEPYERRVHRRRVAFAPGCPDAACGGDALSAFRLSPAFWPQKGQVGTTLLCCSDAVYRLLFARNGDAACPKRN